MSEQLYQSINPGDLSIDTQRKLFELVKNGERTSLYDLSGEGEKVLDVDTRRAAIHQSDGSYKEYTGLSLTYRYRPYDGPSYADCPTQEAARAQATKFYAETKNNHLAEAGELKMLLSTAEDIAQTQREEVKQQVSGQGVIRSRKDIPDNIQKALDQLEPNNGAHICIYHHGDEGNTPVVYIASIGTGSNSHANVSKHAASDNELLYDAKTGSYAENVPDPEALEHLTRNHVPNPLAQMLYEAQERRMQPSRDMGRDSDDMERDFR